MKEAATGNLEILADWKIMVDYVTFEGKRSSWPPQSVQTKTPGFK
jgi:hypothetical protein